MQKQLSIRMASTVGLYLVILAITSLAAATCNSGRAAAPIVAPTSPAATTAQATKPSPTTALTTRPAEGTALAATPGEVPSPRPATSVDWQTEWDTTVAAAKEEGRVVVVGSLGDSHRIAAAAFQRAFPDIHLQFTGAVTRRHASNLLAERSGSRYLLDVLMGAAMEVYDGLLPEGVFDPLRPALLLPEVLDDSKWHGGFDDGWGDKERRYVYQPLGFAVFSVYVNRDMVPESELSSLDQLLDPSWKGKIAMSDARLGGHAAGSLQTMLIGKGEDFVRKLLAQDLAIINDGSQLADAVVRRRYPIGIGIGLDEVRRFTRGALANSIRPLAPDEPGGAALGGGGGSVMLINRAPHPNAARVYVNWVLSQEAQKGWVQATGFNSRRLDVEGPPETAPRVGIKYVRPDRQEEWPYFAQAMDLAKEILK